MGRPLTNFDGAALDGTFRPTLGHEEGLVGWHAPRAVGPSM